MNNFITSLRNTFSIFNEDYTTCLRLISTFKFSSIPSILTAITTLVFISSFTFGYTLLKSYNLTPSVYLNLSDYLNTYGIINVFILTIACAFFTMILTLVFQYTQLKDFFYKEGATEVSFINIISIYISITFIKFATDLSYTMNNSAKTFVYNCITIPFLTLLSLGVLRLLIHKARFVPFYTMAMITFCLFTSFFHSTYLYKNKKIQPTHILELKKGYSKNATQLTISRITSSSDYIIAMNLSSKEEIIAIPRSNILLITPLRGNNKANTTFNISDAISAASL